MASKECVCKSITSVAKLRENVTNLSKQFDQLCEKIGKISTATSQKSKSLLIKRPKGSLTIYGMYRNGDLLLESSVKKLNSFLGLEISEQDVAEVLLTDTKRCKNVIVIQFKRTELKDDVLKRAKKNKLLQQANVVIGTDNCTIALGKTLNSNPKLEKTFVQIKNVVNKKCISPTLKALDVPQPPVSSPDNGEKKQMHWGRPLPMTELEAANVIFVYGMYKKEKKEIFPYAMDKLNYLLEIKVTKDNYERIFLYPTKKDANTIVMQLKTLPMKLAILLCAKSAPLLKNEKFGQVAVSDGFLKQEYILKEAKTIDAKPACFTWGPPPILNDEEHERMLSIYNLYKENETLFPFVMNRINELIDADIQKKEIHRIFLINTKNNQNVVVIQFESVEKRKYVMEQVQKNVAVLKASKILFRHDKIKELPQISTCVIKGLRCEELTFISFMSG